MTFLQRVYFIIFVKKSPAADIYGEKGLFGTNGKDGTLYKRSPYFIGAKLWDALPVDNIELPDIFLFKNRLKRLNKAYVDLLK